MMIPNLNLTWIKYITVALLIAALLYYSHMADKYQAKFNEVVATNARQAAAIEALEAEKKQLIELHEKERQLNAQIEQKQQRLTAQLRHLEKTNKALTVYLDSALPDDLNSWLHENFRRADTGEKGAKSVRRPLPASGIHR